MESYEELLQQKRKSRFVSKEDKQRRCLTGLFTFLLLSALAIGITALVLSIHYIPDPLKVNDLQVYNTSQLNILTASGDSNLTDAYISGNLKVAGNTMLNTVQMMGDSNLTDAYLSGDLKVADNTMLNTVQMMGDSNLTNGYLSGDLKVAGNTMLNTVQMMGDSNLTNGYLSGDLKVAGNTMVDTIQVMTRLTFPDCPESITVGASAEFPTIQSVLDRYVGRLACPVTIIVPPGIYNENIALESTSSSLRNAPLGKGVAIQGDMRFLAGLAFMDGGLHNRPVYFGGSIGSATTPVSVDLTGGNTFTVTVSGLDLSTHGYGAGDKIFIRDNSTTAYTRNIISISSNTVEFDGAPLSDWAEGSYFVFQPNVEIRPLNLNATLAVNGGSLAVRGIMISTPVSNTRAQVQVTGGTLAIAQCFIEDRDKLSMSNVHVSHNGHMTVREFVTETDGGGLSVLTAVGSFEALVETSGGGMEGGNVNQFDAQSSSFLCSTGVLQFDTIQLSDRNNDFKFAIFEQCRVVVKNVISISTGCGFANIYVEGPAAKFECRYSPRALTFKAQDQFAGIYSGSGAQFTTDYCRVEMSNCVYPVLAISDSSVGLHESSTFPSSATDLLFMADFTSRFNLLNDQSGLGGNNMVYEHTASGDMFKANAYRHQDIVAASAIDLTMDITMTDGFGYPDHDGKTYTVTDTTGNNHTITLESGAVFEGCNVPTGSNQIVFDTTPFAQVTMFVRADNRVRIIHSECVTFQIAGLKRDVNPDLHRYYTGPMGAKWANATTATARQLLSRVY